MLTAIHKAKMKFYNRYRKVVFVSCASKSEIFDRVNTLKR